jgi:DNA-binding MarR family transcriptional regulator
MVDAELDDDQYARLLEFRTGLRRFLHWSETQSKAVGVTPAHHQLLLAIRGSRERRGPTIGEVAEHLLLRHHSAVGLVDRAVDAGLVERVVDDTDHRVVRLRLTPTGARRLRQLTRLHLAELERLRANLRPLWSGLDSAAVFQQFGQ